MQVLGLRFLPCAGPLYSCVLISILSVVSLGALMRRIGGTIHVCRRAFKALFANCKLPRFFRVVMKFLYAALLFSVLL